MYKPKEVARIVGISPTSVRQWGKELAEVMSPAANPSAGTARRYEDDDVVILHTAKVLRGEGMSWDNVIDAIESGERILPGPGPESEGEDSTAGADSTAIVDADYWDRMTKPFREHVATLEAQLNKAQADLDEERSARLQAEIAAAEAKTELQVYKDIAERDKPAEEPEVQERRSFLSRLLGR